MALQAASHFAFQTYEDTSLLTRKWNSVKSSIMFSVLNKLTRVESSTEANDVSLSSPRNKLKAKRGKDCK
jgi:hypothetical protein